MTLRPARAAASAAAKPPVLPPMMTRSARRSASRGLAAYWILVLIHHQPRPADCSRRIIEGCAEASAAWIPLVKCQGDLILGFRRGHFGTPFEIAGAALIRIFSGRAAQFEVP